MNANRRKVMVLGSEEGSVCEGNVDGRQLSFSN